MKKGICDECGKRCDHIIEFEDPELGVINICENCLAEYIGLSIDEVTKGKELDKDDPFKGIDMSKRH